MLSMYIYPEVNNVVVSFKLFVTLLAFQSDIKIQIVHTMFKGNPYKWHCECGITR